MEEISMFLFIPILYIIEIVFNIVVFGVITKAIINSIKRTQNKNFFKTNVVDISKENKLEKTYKDISSDKLSKFNTTDLNALKDYVYNIFERFENAYNALDFNTMKELSTKELYHNYHTGITLDINTGRKKIIDDIQKVKVIIYAADSSISKQVIMAMIEIKYISYTLNKDGYIESGSKDTKIIEKFEVTFRKDFLKEDITKCPNCGARITGNKCDYCRSLIKDEEFKIANIRRIITK